MIYLADWDACIETGEQLTDLNWFYDHYGPYLHDIFDTAISDPRFETYRYGAADMISVKSGGSDVNLPDEVLKFVEPVKKSAQSIPFRNFLKRVYSTYPIRTQSKYSKLDLPALAKAYRREKSIVPA